MDKKDIYEHLAKIYLDASLKKKKKNKDRLSLKNLFFLSALVVSIITVFFFISFNKNVPLLSDLNKYKSITSELALVLQSDIIKMNFDFEPAKEETYSINLNKLNLGRFRELGFAVRKANFQDKITLKVEFANAFNEKSELYLNEIPAFKWRDYRIKLTEFKNISDWSEMFNLSFIVENWNTKEKRGLLYIDDIRLIK